MIVYGNEAAPDRFLVQPIYYGLKMFSLGTSHWARIVDLSVVSSTNSHVHAYAALHADSRLSVAVVHKDLNATQPTNVTFSLPLNSSVEARLIRLMAPSIDSEYGVTLAGQTYDGSKDGKPIGEWMDEVVTGTMTASGQVQFQFVVQPLSAVLLWLRLDEPVEPEMLKMVQTE